MSEAAAPGRLSSGSSCSDSHQSVDSDVDSDVLSADGDAGDEVSDLGEEEQQEEGLKETEQPADEEEEIVAAIARHASGTWKVWEDLWFYMTETPGFRSSVSNIWWPTFVAGERLHRLSSRMPPRAKKMAMHSG